jgi:hypothetical protein
MLFNVKINGAVVPIHAKNEGQLSYAVAAMTSAFEKDANKIEEYRNDNPTNEQDGTVNSAAIGRPYPY